MKKAIVTLTLLALLAQPTIKTHATTTDLSLNWDSETQAELTGWDGPVLTSELGVVYGPTGKETYYNLNMRGVIKAMKAYGYTIDDFHVRDDGVKMLGDYIIIATDYETYPKGSIVPTSLGLGISCDTGTALQGGHVDIAVNW